MNTSKNKITFVLSKSRLNASGKCSVRCRITYLKKRFEFATGLFLNPNHWYSKQQITKPPNDENTYINNQLSLIKNKINQAFLLLQIQGIDFSVDDIYYQYKGKPAKQNIGLVTYYDVFLLKYKKLIGIEIKQITWNKFSYIYNDVKDFIKWKFKQNEILLKDVDYSFIVEFEYYLKTEKFQKQVTVNKATQRFKKVVKSAVIGKLIDSFPFIEHKPKKVITNVVYLTTEELESMENYKFSQQRLEQIRDMFVFCCYTGLAFNEMFKLESKHIVIGFDGNNWIHVMSANSDYIDHPIPI